MNFFFNDKLSYSWVKALKHAYVEVILTFRFQIPIVIDIKTQILKKYRKYNTFVLWMFNT